MGHHRVQVGELVHLALMHEQEALARLREHFEMERLVRMDAQQDDVSFVAQAAEELQHEADVAILDRELRLVEQMDERPFALCPLEHPRHPRLAKRANLVGLMIMDRESVPLGITNTVNVTAAHEHTALARSITARDELEECRLARPVGPEHADGLCARDGEVGGERERGRARQAGPVVALDEAFDLQRRNAHRTSASPSPRRAASSARKAGASPSWTIRPACIT